MEMFNGKVVNILNKTEVVDLVNLIVNTKPEIPNYADNNQISKLIDIENIYESEDGLYTISLYFRESDEYINNNGVITYGDFKFLYRVGITKRVNFRFSDISEYVRLFKTIIPDFYDDVSLIFKIDNERVDIDQIDNKSNISSFKIIIRIKESKKDT